MKPRNYSLFGAVFLTAVFTAVPASAQNKKTTKPAT